MKKVRKKPKQFIPSIFTVMNMFLGFLAIGLLMKGDPIRAGWLVLFACFFDVFDGKLARLLGIPSRLERNLILLRIQYLSVLFHR